MPNDMSKREGITNSTKEREYAPEDVFRSVERFLYREARLLDTECLRQWLDEMVHKSIRYLIVSRELRYRRDRRYQNPEEAYIFDDDYQFLETRVNQFHSGNQWRADPPERYRRLVTNIEVFKGDQRGAYFVRSNCFARRTRRAYEVDEFVYCREDVIVEDAAGGLRLLSRQIDFDERSVRGRNMAMFF